MKLVIETQVHELYGDQETGRWKPKGGDTYIVEDYPGDPELIDQVDTVVGFIESNHLLNNEVIREEVVSWSFEEEDYIPYNEQLQIKYEGWIEFPATRVHFNEIARAYDL